MCTRRDPIIKFRRNHETIPYYQSEFTIENVKADILKGHIDFTLRGRLTVETLKLRPQLLELDGVSVDVDITPPPSLFDTIGDSGTH